VATSEFVMVFVRRRGAGAACVTLLSVMGRRPKTIRKADDPLVKPAGQES
jgi:hypothetical protein